MVATLVPVRGDLTIAPAVVEKIAMRAAGEVPDVIGAATGGLPLAHRPDVHAGVSAGARPEQSRATRVELVVRLRYPAPVTRTARAVVRQVTRRVHELTGLTVDEVKVRVDDLVNDAPRRRR